MDTQTSWIDGELVAAARSYLALPPAHRQACGEWERFYRVCDRMIRRFGARLGVPWRDTDDYAQEAWARLIPVLQAAEYDPDRGRFSTWLFVVVRSACVDLHRRGAALRCVPLDSAPEPFADEPPEDPRQRLEQLLADAADQMNDIDRKLLRLRWLEGQSVNDAALTLGLNRQQVWTREHRARKRLRAWVVRFLREES